MSSVIYLLLHVWGLNDFEAHPNGSEYSCIVLLIIPGIGSIVPPLALPAHLEAPEDGESVVLMRHVLIVFCFVSLVRYSMKVKMRL